MVRAFFALDDSEPARQTPAGFLHLEPAMSRNQLHEHAPAEYRGTQRITGDYEMDASIAACKNSDAPKRLKLYVLTDETGHGPRTGYQGYSSYSGDD